MDVNNFSGYFLANTFLSKLNVERDFHLIVVGWILWNYVPYEKIKDWLINKFWKTDENVEEDKVYTVTFDIVENSNKPERRSDQFLALMRHIRKNSPITSSKAITQDSSSYNITCVYEVDQKEKFIVSEENQIYGNISRDVKEGDKGITTKITLTIFSSKLDHTGLTDWIEDITKKWRELCDLPYDPEKQHLFEISYNTKDPYSPRSPMNIHRYHFESNITFDNTFFPNRELLIRELDFFMNGEKDWKDRGWPWQFGVALTGIPGCGKTRILKCIANYTKRHIFLIQINDKVSINWLKRTMSGHLEGYRQVFPTDSFIVVFEELADQTDMVGPRDAPYREEDEKEDEKEDEDEDRKDKKNRKEGTWKSKLEERRKFLSEFLPILDGVNERHGGLMVITTNYIDRLDNAIMRPGRIDYHLHLTKGYDRKSTFDVIKNFWNSKLDKHSPAYLRSDVVDRYTGAELIQECRRLKDDFDKFEEKFFSFHN